MIDWLENWKGAIVIDGVTYSAFKDIPRGLTLNDRMTISLLPLVDSSVSQAPKASDDAEYVIEVKQYMTKKATPEFDFMAKWNNDNPMPLRTMVGKKVKETAGMVFMDLHAVLLQEKTQFCMKCGRPITNPVSQYFGLGPECGQHNYVNPFATDEELRAAVEAYKLQLQNIKWSGWIIKSAITSCEEYKK